MSGKKSVMSKNNCARTSCWWVRACAPHLWFVHLPNWHFSLHLPPLQRPDICGVDNFQRFRFGSLPKSSQESVIQKSLFTFTFTLHTIYKVNGTARYLRVCWPATDNDAIFTLYIIQKISLTLSAFYRASNQLIHRTIDPSIHRSIDPLIHRSIHQYINTPVDQLIHWSIYRSINRSIGPSTDWLIHKSINPSIHRFIDHLIDPSIDPLIHRSIDYSINQSTNPSIHQSIDQLIDRSINQ